MILPEGIVQVVKEALEQENELERFIKTKSDDLIGYHHGLGTWIRNKYGLWEEANVAKYSPDNHLIHTDDLSYEMIIEIHKQLNKEL